MLEMAANMAYAHDFIIRLSKGYDTIVGEKGIRLSGGQKQRIAIARALYKNAPVLILDEATSSLDAVSEIEVQRALENLMKGRTTIIIAHRLSTIMNANRIIVLEKGMIVQEGTHNTLIETDGPYRKLYELQFKEGSQKKIIKIGRK
jgi:ABC-type multidrug transport system fused ATPase/permease subunit